MLKKIFNLPNLTLVTALALSSIAAWFAIAGLIAIFPAKATAIMIMGAIIEVAKIVATMWLRKYWTVMPWQFKATMIPMVVIAMLLTSMGTFGFLSGAHSEQSAVSGDVAAKVAIIDEKIKTERDNIELARKALQQMDAQVDARLSRGDSENSAERAVQIRRQQAGERTRLQKEITDAQAVITKLNEERAPIASQLRKVEAEVGPVKYIAALIYGDSPDANTLEKAVRWVIIMLVLVFDPFAIALVLAGNSSKNWRDPDDELRKDLETEHDIETSTVATVDEEQQRAERIAAAENSTPWPTVWDSSEVEEPKNQDEFDWKKFPYLQKGGFGFKHSIPMVYAEDKNKPHEENNTMECARCGTALESTPIGSWCTNAQCGRIELEENNEETVVNTEPPPPVAKPIVELVKPIKNKAMVDTPVQVHQGPDFKLSVDGETKAVSSGFGSKFPSTPSKGDIFVRVDMLPNKVYKWDGQHWIEVSKNITDSYVYNEAYIEYLIAKVDSGEYDVELLTEAERDQIRIYLSTQNDNRNILNNI